MKKCFTLILTLLFSLAFFTQTLVAQSQSGEVQVGDALVVGEFSGQQDYQFIDFGSANFNIKKGGLYQPRYLQGIKVKVAQIKERNGNKVYVLKPIDGSRFMQVRSLAYVSDLWQAVESGEISTL